MKQFWTTVLGAFIGSFGGLMIFSVISILLSIVFFVAMVGSFSSEVSTKVEPKSVLHISLAGTMPERSNPEDVIAEVFNKEVEGNSLQDILKSIDIASKNDNIKGIYLECGEMLAGTATVNELRTALLKFKKHGKWIYAYSNEFMTQSNYYLASTADSIFINPMGMLDVRGLAMTTSFYKDMLAKVGIEMQVVKVGSFKSAVEPYLQNEISEANRLQQEYLLGQLWGYVSKNMADARHMPIAKLNEYADSVLMTKTTSFLLENKLVDGICYKPKMEDKLKDKTDSDDLHLVSPKELIATESISNKENKIAVLYAVGEINSASEKGIVADEMIENINEAADDDNVKALVMRVNSPGGSAFDSEQIWAALEEFKKSKKPFVVSMSDYAASGGYYISCGADIIYADPLTITGSIGIFGVIPCLQDLYENKIGITESLVQTNANASFPTISKKMTPYQRQAMQNNVNQGYELFTSRCAKGRGMTQDAIKAIGEGRVWDGTTAKKIGLVDVLGGLDDAIKKAAALAKINDYTINAMPKQKDMFEKYLSKYLVTKIKSSIMGENATLFKYQEMIDHVLKQDHIQARMDMVTVL